MVINWHPMEPKPFEVVVPFPAGSMSSTAGDMARFMLAHLQDGQLGDARILRPETAQLMHSRLFALDQAANAMAYGFYEESRNGHRIIGHGGDTLYFHSDLHLIPDAGVGFFVSHNSLGGGKATRLERRCGRCSWIVISLTHAPATPTLAQRERRCQCGQRLICLEPPERDTRS